MTVLVAGASGRLGSALARDFADRARVVRVTRTEADVTDARAVHAVVARERPQVIVNCTAYNDVDGAEAHAVEALAINAMAVRNLAHAARAADALLVQYSTDFVFDGRDPRPYREDDAAAPLSTYGMSKLLGEWFAADVARHYVLRVASLFGGTPYKSRVDVLIDDLRSGTAVRAFVDRTVTPSYVPDVVDATWSLITRPAPAGVYHCVSSGETTWAELAREIARLVGADPAKVIEVETSDVKGGAARPRLAGLSNQRLVRAGIELPSWQDALRRHIAVRAVGGYSSPGLET